MHPRVEIVSTKHFLHDATWSGAYGDITWVSVLQLNSDTSEHVATEYASCGLTPDAPLEAAENVLATQQNMLHMGLCINLQVR